jgi:N-acetylmuramoyl-L-alanine amidase
MSKYIASIPLADIARIAILTGNGRSMAQVKGDADYICNAGFYDMTTGRPVGHLKADGAVLAKEVWGCWGFAWDRADIKMAALPAAAKNYISGVEMLSPMIGIHDAMHYRPEVGGSRPRTAMALTGDKLLLYCADSPTTPEALRDTLYKLGAETAIMLDGGGSSQCDFAGQKISSSRRVHNYLAVWLRKKEDEPVSKTVCLDPGHGVESPGKCSPDKSYYEHEFALDMARRIQAHLERCGVRVVLTRTDEHCPTGKANTNDLLKRVAISDAAGADLFVSIHSNASGNEWSNASGLMIYTSAGPETASRNVAAKAVLSRMTAAGVELRGSPLVHDIELVVTRETVAPAMLIEYGFHTSRTEVALLKNGSYRAKLAEATAKGVCGFLGVAWAEITETEPTDTGAADWAATAWEKAKSKGVLDGTRPTDPVTRQELAVVLDRLNLI